MRDKDRIETLLVFMQNVDVFAWSSYEVPGVDPEFIVHKLNVDPLFPPKKQKPRKLAKEHIEAVRQEVRRLKEAGAIREILFPYAENRSIGGCQIWALEDEFFRCLLRLSPDYSGHRGSGKDNIYLP